MIGLEGIEELGMVEDVVLLVLSVLIKIFCIGFNYRYYVEEMNKEVLDELLMFMKLVSVLFGLDCVVELLL